MKRGLVIGALLVGLGTSGIALAALLPETPVLSTSRNERNPAADTAGTTEVLAYTRSRAGAPNRYDAWAQRGSEAAVKLNENGQGWTGGIDYPIVPYQQVNSSQSDIWLYDLSTDTTIRQAAPALVNTSRWEWHPSFSGDLNDYYLLFGRDNTGSPTQRVVLYHHTTGTPEEPIVLDFVTKATHYLQPDQVNGDWVTWTKCAPNCNVFLHRISTDETTRLPRPVTDRPRQQYAGAVSADGDVYLVRSGPRCGDRVRIVRYNAEGTDGQFGTIVAALPSGRDIAFAFLREQSGGARDVFYDRVGCTSGKFDVYKVTDPPPGP